MSRPIGRTCLFLFLVTIWTTTYAYLPLSLKSRPSLDHYRFTRSKIVDVSRQSFIKLSSTTNNNNDDDDEIAKLEEKIRQLREAKNKETTEDMMTTDDMVVTNEIPTVVDISTETQLPLLEEMLSERWKEEEGTDMNPKEENVPIIPIVASILAIVFGIAFSQIPIGEEGYMKYSAIKTSTPIDLGDLNDVRTKSLQGL